MELLYIWIKKINSLTDAGLNFGGECRFEYNPENGELISKIDEDYISNFFSQDISNVTALVGTNGSGKSSVIEFLIENLPNGRAAQPQAIIIHYNKDEGSFIIYKHPDINIVLIDPVIHIHYTIVEQLRNDYHYPEIVYFTNSLYDRIIDDKTDGVINSSLKTQLFNSEKRARTGEEFLLRFKFNEYLKITRFLVYFLDFNLPIDLPSYLVLSTIFTTEINFDDWYLEENNRLKYKEFFERIINHYNSNLHEKTSSKAKFLNIVERNIILDEFSSLNLLEVKPSLIEEILNDPKDIFKIISKSSQQPKKMADFIAYLDKIIEDDAVSMNSEIAWIDLKIHDFREMASLLGKIRDLSHYNSNFLQLGLSHSKYSLGEMSSGEFAMLSLFSRLFALSRREQVFANLEIEKNVLILLDEPELYLHATWQKNLIKYLIDLTPAIFYKIDIQIMLTSHSPFVLSDLPKNKVCFLTKGTNFGQSEILGHKQTFASNIHTLLSDSFFMNDGFIGEFAKSKINSVIADLNTSKKISNERKTDVKKIIMSIGEPIIKRRLLEMYNAKFNLEVDDRLTNIENLLGL